MGVIRCCRDCKPPKRNGYCHTYCEEYKAEKSAYEELRTEANRKKFLDFELSAQREKACDFCKGRAYTKKPVTIITTYGKRFQMVFEHCPNCGRKLRKEKEDGK